MSRHPTNPPRGAAARPPPSRPGARPLSAIAILALLLIAAALTSVTGAALFNRNSFLRGLLTRIYGPLEPGWKEWASNVQREIQSAPLADATQEALEAHRQVVRIAGAWATGELNVSRAAADASSLAARDAGNGLTRWLAVCMEAARVRSQGGDALGALAALRAGIAAPPAVIRTTTYERVEALRSREILSRFVPRADVAVSLTPKDPDPALSDALSRLVAFIDGLADDLTRINRIDDARQCRTDAAGLMRAVLHDDPTPQTALLAASLLERVARRLGGAAVADDAPTATRAVSLAGAEEWPRLAADARRFQTELCAAIEMGGFDVLDRRPIPIRGGGAYSALLSSMFGAMLLLLAGLTVAAAALARACLTALARPAAADRSRAKSAPPRPPATAEPTPSWRRVFVAAAAVSMPPVVAMMAWGERLTGRGPSYQLWPLAAACTALLASALVGHVLCGEFLLRKLGKVSPAAPPVGRSRRLGFLAAAGLLTIYPLFPPVWSSRFERGVYALWFHGWLWLPALLLALGAIAWALRSVLRRPRQRSSPVGLRAYAAMAASTWLVAALLSCCLTIGQGVAERRYLSAVAQGTNRIAPLVGDDWRIQYFREQQP